MVAGLATRPYVPLRIAVSRVGALDALRAIHTDREVGIPLLPAVCRGPPTIEVATRLVFDNSHVMESPAKLGGLESQIPQVDSSGNRLIIHDKMSVVLSTKYTVQEVAGRLRILEQLK